MLQLDPNLRAPKTLQATLGLEQELPFNPTSLQHLLKQEPAEI